MFSDNKNERKKWWSTEVIMSMCGVPMEVSGCDSNVECSWRYKWIKLTLKVSELDENGGWIIVMRKTNAVKTEVYENEDRRIQWRWRCLHVTLKAITLFVVQPTGSAPDSTGSAQRGNVSTRILCVTAKTTVATVLTKETAVSCFFMTVVLLVVVIVAAWAFDVKNICVLCGFQILGCWKWCVC